MNKYGLGRGLGSLIPKKADLDQEAPKLKYSDDEIGTRQNFSVSTVGARESVLDIDVDCIKPNPYQPRNNFNTEKLEELISSIKEHGIIQPIIVTKLDELSDSGKQMYQLVAGERRLKSAKSLNMFKVPAIVREMSDMRKLELALIENIQRANLDFLEEAESYERLMNEFNLTQEDVAKKVGKSRSTVANILRLNKLPSDIKKMLSDDRITFGHAKLLLSLDDVAKQKKLLKKILDENLSVHDTDDVAKQIVVKTHTRVTHKDPNITSFEDRLQKTLNTKVRINDKNGKGSISIEYYSKEDLRSVLGKMLRD